MHKGFAPSSLLTAALLVVTVGITGCTAPEDQPAPSMTATTPSPDKLEGTVALISTLDGITGLDTNGEPDLHLNPDGSVIFTAYTSFVSLPGSDLAEQIYIWTPQDGVTLVTNVGTLEEPVGASRGGDFLAASSNGLIVFKSDDASFPGGNGHSQLYVWSAADGVTLLSNAGTGEEPVGAGDRPENGPTDPPWDVPTRYAVATNSTGAVVFATDGTGLPGTSLDLDSERSGQVYLWTAASGLTLLSNAGTRQAPTGADGSGCWRPSINEAGKVAFSCVSPNLPGANSKSQVYLWTSDDGLALVSNAGSKKAPVGADAHSGITELSEGGAILIESDWATNLPGATGAYGGLYVWTAKGGLVHIGDDCDSGWSHFNDDGSVLFVSRSTSLPGANGFAQLYLWSEASGVTLISNAGAAQVAVGADSNITIPTLARNGVVLFQSQHASNLPGGRGPQEGEQLYAWTPSEGVKLVSNAGTAEDPRAGNGFSTFVQILNDGSVLFMSSATDLPDGTGGTQVYRWAATRGIAAVEGARGPRTVITNADRSSSLFQANTDGAIAFVSSSSGLPGFNGHDQVYLWRPA